MVFGSFLPSTTRKKVFKVGPPLTKLSGSAYDSGERFRATCFIYHLIFLFQRMSEVYKIEENKIKLDIGGQQFTTSLLTLTKDTSSMLAAMFSGRHRLKVEVDGSYFIDRDGTHFRYILNYLRDGCIKEGTMPSNPTLWRELMTEAEYYQLSGLAEYLRSLLGGSVSRSSSASGLSEETSGT